MLLLYVPIIAIGDCTRRPSRQVGEDIILQKHTVNRIEYIVQSPPSGLDVSSFRGRSREGRPCVSSVRLRTRRCPKDFGVHYRARFFFSFLRTRRPKRFSRNSACGFFFSIRTVSMFFFLIRYFHRIVFFFFLTNGVVLTTGRCRRCIYRARDLAHNNIRCDVPFYYFVSHCTRTHFL